MCSLRSKFNTADEISHHTYQNHGSSVMLL